MYGMCSSLAIKVAGNWFCYRLNCDWLTTTVSQFMFTNSWNFFHVEILSAFDTIKEHQTQCWWWAKKQTAFKSLCSFECWVLKLPAFGKCFAFVHTIFNENIHWKWNVRFIPLSWSTHTHTFSTILKNSNDAFDMECQILCCLNKFQLNSNTIYSIVSRLHAYFPLLCVYKWCVGICSFACLYQFVRFDVIQKFPSSWMCPFQEFHTFNIRYALCYLISAPGT